MSRQIVFYPGLLCPVCLESPLIAFFRQEMGESEPKLDALRCALNGCELKEETIWQEVEQKFSFGVRVELPDVTREEPTEGSELPLVLILYNQCAWVSGDWLTEADPYARYYVGRVDARPIKFAVVLEPDRDPAAYLALRLYAEKTADEQLRSTLLADLQALALHWDDTD